MLRHRAELMYVNMWPQWMHIKWIIFRKKEELHCFYCTHLGKPKNADVSRNLPVFRERSICFSLFIILYNSICNADNNSGENEHHFPWQDTNKEWATPYIFIKTTNQRHLQRVWVLFVLDDRMFLRCSAWSECMHIVRPPIGAFY